MPLVIYTTESLKFFSLSNQIQTSVVLYLVQNATQLIDHKLTELALQYAKYL